MYIPFEQLPSDARIWIYQADRVFSGEEEKMISAVLRDFCAQWMVHGQPLQTSYKIEYHQFLILSVNENAAQASGCSIDGSVRVIKELGEQLHIDFFNRLKSACLIDDHIAVLSRQEIVAAFSSGKVSSRTITFNNLVATKGEFEKSWKVEIENTWLAKYLPKDALSS